MSNILNKSNFQRSEPQAHFQFLSVKAYSVFFAPEGSTAAQAARFAAEKTIQTGVLYRAITGIGGVVELALGGTASPSTGKTNIPLQQSSINQKSTAQSQSSFSLLSNYTSSKYLNAATSFTSSTKSNGKFYTVGVASTSLLL